MVTADWSLADLHSERRAEGGPEGGRHAAARRHQEAPRWHSRPQVPQDAVRVEARAVSSSNEVLSHKPALT